MTALLACSRKLCVMFQLSRLLTARRIGTYALVGMVLVLHMKLHALAALPASSVGAALVAVHCASRWSSVPLLYFCTYIQVGPAASIGPVMNDNQHALLQSKQLGTHTHICTSRSHSRLHSPA